MKKRVAIITNDTSFVGGLPTMVAFLHSTLEASGRYEPHLISLATSASDRASVRIKSPGSWFRRPQIEQVERRKLVFTHFGVWGSELEFQRYRPRRELTEHLQKYNLLQFVVGCPPWGCVAAGINRPILIWTATTTRGDRASRRRDGSLTRRAWSTVMVPMTERCEKRSLRMANKVFALSEYTRDVVEPLAGRGKVMLAPCGVDTNLFRPMTKAAGKYILCVARFSDARKNVRLLLDAYANLQRNIQEVPDLYLIGDPPTEDAQAHLQKLGIADNVYLIGPKQGEALAEVYRNAAFFVLSSDEEGLGIVILEAMASGLPVVSTDCGGPATAITDGETGFLTPVGDAGALAATMEKLLVDPSLRERMGRQGRRVAEERFSLSAAGQVFLDTYDKVLDNNAARVPSAASLQNCVLTTPASVHD
jgi:D-inositol-3-phosphate glycosyltransferase